MASNPIAMASNPIASLQPNYCQVLKDRHNTEDELQAFPDFAQTFCARDGGCPRASLSCPKLFASANRWGRPPWAIWVSISWLPQTSLDLRLSHRAHWSSPSGRIGKTPRWEGPFRMAFSLALRSQRGRRTGGTVGRNCWVQLTSGSGHPDRRPSRLEAEVEKERPPLLLGLPHLPTNL